MGAIKEELELKQHRVWNCVRKNGDMESTINPAEARVQRVILAHPKSIHPSNILRPLLNLRFKHNSLKSSKILNKLTKFHCLISKRYLNNANLFLLNRPEIFYSKKMSNICSKDSFKASSDHSIPLSFTPDDIF
jgi:hypothetical protein